MATKPMTHQTCDRCGLEEVFPSSGDPVKGWWSMSVIPLYPTVKTLGDRMPWNFDLCPKCALVVESAAKETA